MNKLVVALVTTAFLTVGCGSVRPTSPPDDMSCGLDRFWVNDVYSHDLLLAQALTSSPQSFNVLALSAGGEFGAYGSGFLAGWGSVGEAALPSPRSDIQVVTGVSTGALMASHAYIGDLDEEMVAQYSTLASSSVFRRRGALELIRANSLYDTSGKDRLISSIVNRDIIDRVDQVAQETHRGLFIGYVNLDTGEFKRVDMIRLVHGYTSKEQRDLCYQAVIGASSAIPIVFAPKFVDGAMLVDGGARWHTFLTQAPLEVVNSEARRRVFSFIHGDLAVDAPSGGVGDGVLPIAEETASLATDSGLKNSIRLLQDLASQPVPGSSGRQQLTMFDTFFAAAASASAACESQRSTCGTDDFCPAFEKCLADEGRRDGVAATSPQQAPRPTGRWLRFEDLCLGTQPEGCNVLAPEAIGTHSGRPHRRIFQ